MPPKNPSRDPGRDPKVGSPNPESRVKRGGGISRRSFLKWLGVGEYLARKHEADTAELLRGADFNREIRGIKIYVDINSMRKNSPLLEGLVESLKPMISILSDEMVRRIRFIRLGTFLDNSILPEPFKGEAHVGVGIEIKIYPNRFKNGKSPEIAIRLAEVFFHEVVHLITFGNPDKFSRMLRDYGLSKCQDLQRCIVSLTDLIDKQFVKEWLEISRQNGGYVSVMLIPVQRVDEEDLNGYKNFGYILDDPNLRYGRLNLAEDIACVFEKILSSLYKVIHREEDPKAVINALLSKTPDETGLHKKYLIACESLIGWYEKGSEQHKILREFIQIIEDAIIIAKGTTNGQSIQTNQGAIKRQETTDGQETPLKSLMERLAKIRELGRKGPS